MLCLLVFGVGILFYSVINISRLWTNLELPTVAFLINLILLKDARRHVSIAHCKMTSTGAANAINSPHGLNVYPLMNRSLISTNRQIVVHNILWNITLTNALHTCPTSERTALFMCANKKCRNDMENDKIEKMLMGLHVSWCPYCRLAFDPLHRVDSHVIIQKHILSLFLGN